MVDTADSSRQERLREKLRLIVSGSGGPKTVSRLVGISLHSLNKYLSGAVAEPPATVIARIAQGCGADVAWLLDDAVDSAGNGMPDGFAEAAPVPLDEPIGWVPERPEANHGRWRVTSRALDAIGILPGDIVDFALGQPPRKGEVVVAQVYRLDRPSADTVLRVFEPPYLMIRSLDPDLDPRPLLIEEGKVVVMGRFHRLLRERAD